MLQFMLKRFIFPLTIIFLFLLAACGTAPLSKEEASEQKQTEEKNTDAEAGNQEEQIGEVFGLNMKNASDVQASHSSVQTDEEAEKESEQSEESSKEQVDDDSGSARYANASDERNQSNSSITTTPKDDTTTNAESDDDSQSSSKSNQSTSSSEKKTGNTSSSSNKDSTKEDPPKKSDSKEKESSGDDQPKQKDEPKETPTEESEPDSQPEKNNMIVHSIVISDSEVPLPPTEMEIEDGDTVLDALIKITKKHQIQMDYRGGQGATAYVEGMDNVYEFDRGPGSGWMYRVNGIFPDRSAGIVPLLPGDRVEWLYTTDLGNDLGADLKPFRR